MRRKLVSCCLMGLPVAATAHAEIVGTWCDKMIPSMKKYDAVMTITTGPAGGYHLKVRHGDGSESNTPVVRLGKKFITNNDFGEYYEIRQNGALAIFDNEGFIRAAKSVDPTAIPGKCR